MTRLSLPALLTQLFQDAKDVVQAEIGVARSKAMARVREARAAIILFVAALIVALASIGGFVTGIVLALTRLVGGALAGVIVLAGGLLIAGLLAWAGARQFGGPAPADDTETRS